MPAARPQMDASLDTSLPASVPMEIGTDVMAERKKAEAEGKATPTLLTD